jgi:hypothetical protein
MTVNLRFLTARRRDRQQRELHGFLQSLRQEVAGLPSQLAILNPESSVRLEQSLPVVVQEHIAAKTLARETDLSWTQVADWLHHICESWSTREVAIYLCHYPDFMFWLPFDIFVELSRDLLIFDNDTVYAVSENLQWGLGIDMFVCNAQHSILYSTDIWGVDTVG